eukprot:7261064-Prymnesium_polylepis.1
MPRLKFISSQELNSARRPLCTDSSRVPCARTDPQTADTQAPPQARTHINRTHCPSVWRQLKLARGRESPERPNTHRWEVGCLPVSGGSPKSWALGTRDSRRLQLRSARISPGSR